MIKNQVLKAKWATSFDNFWYELASFFKNIMTNMYIIILEGKWVD